MINDEKLKILTNIREKITAYFPTDDNRLDPDYIWEQIKIVRNIFIEKMFQEDKRNAEEFYSRIKLPLKDYDGDTLIDNPDYDPEDPDSEEYITNPDYEPDMPDLQRILMPPLINLQGNIRYLGPGDRSDEYVRVTMETFFHLQGRDFTEGRIYYLPFRDRVFFNQPLLDSLDEPLTEVEAWVLLEDPEDDPEFDSATDPIIPKKYQLLVEDMVSDNILKYARSGILSRENDATDRETTQGR